MRRKIILMGGKTHVISLPLKWIKKYQVKKGQELELQENQNKILVSTDSKPALKEIDLNLTNTDTSTIVRNIVTCYQTGFNFLNIKFDKKVLNLKTNKQMKTIDLIQDTCDQLIGFEITEQKEGFCHIKDITDNSINEFNKILRRTFLMLNCLSTETLDYLKGKETEDLHKKHVNIRRFTNYCRRYLNIFGVEDKTNYYNELLLSIEEISRTYRLITKRHRSNQNKDIQKILKRTIKLQEEFQKFFYKYKIEKSTDIIKERLEIFQEINKFQSTEKEDIVLVHRIPNILNRILSLINVTIAINFNQN